MLLQETNDSKNAVGDLMFYGHIVDERLDMACIAMLITDMRHVKPAALS